MKDYKVKYKTTVPLNKNYNPQIEKALIIIFVVLMVILGCVAFSSCNTTSKAYEKIAKVPPQTQKDTLNLDKRAKEQYKPQPPKVVPGKTVIKTVVKEDTAKVHKLQDKIDSLVDELAFSNDLLNSVPKLDSLKKAIRKEVLKDCKPQVIQNDVERTDTVYLPDISKDAEISTLTIKVSEQNKSLSATEDKIKKYEEQRDSIKWVLGRFFRLLFGEWWFILLLVLSGGFAYLKLKKKIPFLP